MKKLLFLVTILSFLIACVGEHQHDEQSSALAISNVADTAAISQSSSGTVNAIPGEERKSSIAEVQIGMRDEKVRAILGKPTKVDVITSELGARMEDWWYGKNQKVRITGGEVTRIIPDVDKEQETLLKIKTAKEKGDETEAKRLMEEIGVNN